MHDQGLGFHQSCALDRQSVGEGELIQAGDERTRTSFALKSKEADDVGPRERLVEVMHHRDGPGRDLLG